MFDKFDLTPKTLLRGCSSRLQLSAFRYKLPKFSHFQTKFKIEKRNIKRQIILPRTLPGFFHVRLIGDEGNYSSMNKMNKVVLFPKKYFVKSQTFSHFIA